ncbi:MAG: MFS transporter [Betaproteobacteria bacterium]|jgi:MFS family permease|nr:MFS transporter [Betaproteobacteria bacterium]
MSKPDRSSDHLAAGTQWLVVWVAFAAGVVAAAHIGKLPPALPEIRAELNVGLVTAGWIASTISATSFALGLFAGAIADRVGHRRVLAFGLSTLAVGSLLGAFAQSGESMLASRFVEGLGFTSCIVAGGAIIARATSYADRRWALGVWAAYMPVGFAGMLMVSALVVERFGWRLLWGMGCVVTLACALIFLFATAGWQRTQIRSTHRDSILRSVGRSVTVPGAVLVALTFGLYAAQHISMMNWLPTYMVEVHGSAALISAGVPALVLAFNAAGSYLGGWAMGRGAPIWFLLTLGSVGMAITEIAMVSEALPDALRLVIACGFGIAGGMIPAAALAAAPVYASSPALIGSMGGLMVMGSNTGQLFGPPVLAAGREYAGSWEGTLGLLLSFAIAAAALSLASRTMERRAARATHLRETVK